MASPCHPDVSRLTNALLSALPPRAPLLLGFSGGLDSTVLLHALVHAGAGDRLRAVHVNHGLHQDAQQWQQHCEAQCRALSVPLEVVAVSLADGPNLEARARQARYHAIDGIRRGEEVLVLAHHQDDQAETILFRLLRGAGVPALSGMRADTARAGLLINRPLLVVPQALLARVADHWSLRWVEDPANVAERFDRNYLRHQVLPVLAQRWPASERLVQAGRQFAEAGELLDALAGQDASDCDVQGQCLDLGALAALSPARRRNLLSWWLRDAGQQVPDRQILERVDSEIIAAGADRNPLLRWSSGAFARHGERLWWLLPDQLEPLPERTHWDWQQQPRLVLAPACTLRITDTGDDAHSLCLRHIAAPLTVARAGGGERLLQRGMHRQVSELWRVAGVPVWQRARLPLLYHGDTLVAAAGIGVADDWLANADDVGVCIHVTMH